MDSQGQLNFETEGSEQGYTQWLVGRRVTAKALARRMGLPLGHLVEVWLYGGVRLRGELRLKEELLFIEEDHIRHLQLVVDHVAFAYREMESCISLD